MIPVLRLVQSLRYALRDMQGAKVSDFELIESINQAASLLYSQMSERFVQFGMKKKIIVVGSTGSVSLPADFIKIHQVGLGENKVAVPTTYQPTVDGTYRIMGDTFYAPAGSYSLEYYYVPIRVTDLSESLDVPQSMSPYIERIALAIYGNNHNEAMTIALACAESLAAREHSHFENVGTVQVLGGRI
ncbi:MAG: hypothetical protein IJQ57_01265 [Synergistaceae bacterium]|nr:hypothetical protein [Synergistaceae bacterium]